MDESINLPRGSRKHPMSPWTDERLERLRTRWSQGASVSKISQELGGGISRSAVIGKIHRLGIVELSPHGGARVKRPKGEKTRHAPRRVLGHHVVAQHPGEQRQLPVWVADAKPYIDNPLIDADIPRSQRCTFAELSSRTCRWPVGDPSCADFFFCGTEPFPGKPYCGAHCARAYRPPEDARQRAPSARLRRAMLRFRGFDTYIRRGGETAAERRWIGEEG